MAGGQNKASTGLPAWLVQANADTRAAALEAQEQRQPQRQVHCWMRGASGQWPGLVLDWRREGAGWAALAAWTTGVGDVVSAWVDAETVTSLDAS